jgi:hypothetical protein
MGCVLSNNLDFCNASRLTVRFEKNQLASPQGL